MPHVVFTCRRAGSSFSLAGVAENEVVELVLFVPGSFAGRGKEREEQFAEMLGPHAVKVVLSLAARLDQTGNPQQCQVMAHRRLALPEPVAQIGDVKLAVGRQGKVEQNAQTVSRRSKA